MPASLHFVYPVFRQLCMAGRRFEGGMPLPIPPSEILAWCINNRCRLSSSELELLTILDHAWIQAMRVEEQPT